MLPKIQHPIFKVNLKFHEPVHIRPMIVKEEKIVLMASESLLDEDYSNYIIACSQIIQNCVQEDINVEELYLVDFEILLLNIRKISISDELAIAINNSENKSIFVDTIKIDDYKIENDFYEKPIYEIKMDENLIIHLSFPKVKDVLNDLQFSDDVNKMLIDCLKSISMNDEVYAAEDFSENEIKDFYDSLSFEKWFELTKFVEKIPYVKYDIEYTNPETGESTTQVLSGASNFFL